MQEIPIDKIDDFPNHPFKVRIASFVFGGEPALKLSSLSCTGVGAGSQVYGLEFVGAFGFLVVCYLPPSPGWLSLTLYLYYNLFAPIYQGGILHIFASIYLCYFYIDANRLMRYNTAMVEKVTLFTGHPHMLYKGG